MQAGEPLDEIKAQTARALWDAARQTAAGFARELETLGVHKQWANRLIEPFGWVSVIVSATDWHNFYALRCHPEAQPEFQTIARMMREAHAAASPVLLQEGEWHLPLLFPEDQHYSLEVKRRLSAGRCARVSYLTHDGRRDPDADLTLCDRLLESGHMSPFEHQARCMDVPVYYANFRGWKQFRKQIEEDQYEDQRGPAECALSECRPASTEPIQ
jgi:hypothetical protein